MAKLTADGAGCYRLEGRLDFDTIPPLLQQSNNLFGFEGVISIDLSAVSQSNSAGLALLLEWMCWARQQNRQIQFSHLPETMLSIAEACDLKALLPIKSI